MKRKFTAVEKEFVFDSWKNGTGFSDIAKTLDSKPGTILAILRDSVGMSIADLPTLIAVAATATVKC